MTNMDIISVFKDVSNLIAGTEYQRLVFNEMIFRDRLALTCWQLTARNRIGSIWNSLKSFLNYIFYLAYCYHLFNFRINYTNVFAVIKSILALLTRMGTSLAFVHRKHIGCFSTCSSGIISSLSNTTRAHMTPTSGFTQGEICISGVDSVNRLRENVENVCIFRQLWYIITMIYRK